jgi:hypothetical protein
MLERQAIPGQWLTITRGTYTGHTFQLTKEALDTETFRMAAYLYQDIFHTGFDVRLATREEIIRQELEEHRL